MKNLQDYISNKIEKHKYILEIICATHLVSKNVLSSASNAHAALDYWENELDCNCSKCPGAIDCPLSLLEI